MLRRPTLDVAKALLGMKLSTQIKGKLTSGMITEVEAYHQDLDRASHCFGGKQTQRNKVMYGQPGLCYVYFIYGMHNCVNIVTEEPGIGAAVLIRAIEPVEGIGVMARRRHLTTQSANLTNGPGKLCQALGISKALNGQDVLTSSKIWLEAHQYISPAAIETSRRIGISKSKSLPWRYFVAHTSLP